MIRRTKVLGEESIGDLKVTYETIDGFTADNGMVVSAIGTQYTDRKKEVYLEKHSEMKLGLVKGNVNKVDFI